MKNGGWWEIFMNYIYNNIITNKSRVEKKSLFILISLILMLLSFSDLVLAYNRNFNEIRNDNTVKGTYTYYQESSTNVTLTGMSQSNKIIPIDKKSYISVNINFGYTGWGSTASAKVFNNNKQLGNGWEGNIYPSDGFKVSTYAYKGWDGYASAVVSINISPYYNLTFTETGGNGTVLFYKNSSNTHTLTNDRTVNQIAKGGDQIYLVAKPSEGYKFSSWQANYTGTNPTTSTFYMNSDKIIIAVFNVKTVTFPTGHIEYFDNGNIQVRWDFVSDSSNFQYQLALTGDNVTEPTNSDIFTTVTNKNYILTDLDSNKEYSLWVRTIDNEGNISNWVSSDRFSPSPPSSTLALNDVNFQIINGEASYSVELQLDDPNVTNYILERSLAGSNSWDQYTVSKDTLATNNYIYTDTNNLQSHGNYLYKVHTENAAGDISGDSATVQVVIPNIQTSFDLPVEHISPTNENQLYIDLLDNDIEGDNIKFRVLYKLNEEGAEIHRSSAEMQSGPVQITFPSDGEWLWWLEVEESNDDFTTTYETENRIYNIDTTEPNGNLAITDENGNEYTADLPTNTSVVRLDITGLNDSSGEIDSGIEKVTIYNGTTMPAKIYTDALDAEGNLKSAIAAEIAAGTAGVEASGASQYNLPWVLKDGEYGARTVSIEIKDNAGNIKTITRLCTLDTTPPPLSESYDHSHSIKNENKLITFSWQNSASDVSNFLLTYNNQEYNVEPSIVNEVVNGSYQINVNTLGYNQAVSIEVTAVDKAGNQSDPASYTAYTKAEVGSIGETSGGYSDGYGHHLMFNLLEPASGNATSHQLEYGIYENGEFNKAQNGSIVLSADGTFTHSNLEAHEENDYRLVAYNQSGDPTYAVVEENIEVPNTPPTAPVIDDNSYPLNWTISLNDINQVEFSYSPADDVDNDTLDHIVYWVEGDYQTGKPETWNIYNIGDPASTPIIIDPTDITEHGKTYTWYVKAKEDTEDYHEESESSNRVTFTVDLNTPAIKIEDLDFYTNEESISVTASDKLDSNNSAEVYSDIDHIIYNLLYSDGSQTEEVKVTDLVSDGHNGWEAQLPLIEGEYTLQLSAVDKADNSSNIINKELKVDNTDPEINSYSLDTLKELGVYKTYSNNVVLNIDMEDILSNEYASGIRKLKYWFVINQGEELNHEPKVKNIVNSIDSYQLELDMSDLTDGQQYYLAIQAVDNAGNTTVVKYSDSILIDQSAPIAFMEVSGLKPYGDQNYLAELEELDISSSALDQDSDINDRGFNIYSIENDKYLNAEWIDLQSIKNTSLNDGQEYYLAFQAVNGVGNKTTVKTENFIYDSTGPTNPVLNVPTGKFISGETVIFTAEAVDNHSPITSYRLAIGSTSDGTELTSLIAGNTDGYLEMEFINSEYRLTFPEVEDGIYYTTLLVTNAAGMTTTYQGSNIEIDNAQEKLVVNDEGPYTALDKQLSAEWQYSGEREIVEYKYRIKIKGGGYITEEEITTGNIVTVTGLDLEQGQTYQFEVTAVYSGGIAPLLASSTGVTVDTTDPEIISFTPPEYSTSEKIEFNWDGYDNESSINKVEVALGTDYRKTDVTNGWVELINNRLNYDSNGQPLNLKTGQHYYPMLRITNGADKQTDISGSSIIIDNTPPPVPIVDDHAQYINPGQPIVLDWTMTELQDRLDPESGNVKYYWSYSNDISELSLDNKALSWNEVGSRLKQEFENISQVVDGEITNGTNYYFAVKAVNGAGLESIGLANGLIVDSDAPSIPILKVLSTVNLAGQEELKEVSYLNSIEDVKLWITSTDSESMVNKYMYAYGLKDQVEDAARTAYDILDENEYNQPQVIDITNPDLEEGVIYQFAGESYNGADLISQTGRSSGVILDISAPKITNVNGIASSSNLIFDWDLDPESSRSPIVRYETAIVTSPTEIPEQWNDNGLSKTITIDASTYNDGRYYLKVRAFNAAGNHSRSGEQYNEVGISPVVILDRTPPEVTEFVHPEYVHDSFETIIKALDNELGSGISAYQYALGSYVDSTLYSGDWQEVINNADHAEIDDQISVELATASINTGEEIYLRARVKDNVDKWSEVKRSSKIVVDHTAPIVVKISINGPETVNTTDKIMGLSLTYDGAEDESEITHYRLSVAEEKDDQKWETDPQSQLITDFDNKVKGLALEETEYYLAIELFNSVGLSTVKYSEEPVVIDITPPEFDFIDTNDELVFNNPSPTDPGEVKYRLNEIADVTFVLTKPGGDKVEYETEEDLLANQEYVFDFTENDFGRYTLTPTVVDKAGNIMVVEVSKEIRVNEPPVITFSEDDNNIAFYTTKGKELTLKPTTAYDPDGGSIVSYQWDTGEEPVVNLSGREPVHKYIELDEYIITLTATDNDAGATTVTSRVKVENTTQGQLYMDETWSGTHYIFDDILVPAGIKLTMGPGTEVIIDGIAGDSGYYHLLEVAGELEINGQTGNEVVISSVKNQVDSWQGIKISGQAAISGLDIKEALRGLTVIETGQATIQDSVFRNNKVGLHVYGSSPELIGTQFIDNLLYGIKEDNGGRPIVIDSTFTGNGIDYYHQELNKITIEELNNIDGNSGNIGQ